MPLLMAARTFSVAYAVSIPHKDAVYQHNSELLKQVSKSDLLLEDQILPTLQQMIRQFAEFPQVVNDRGMLSENQRLQRNFSVGDVVLLSINAHQRHLRSRVCERLTFAAAPRAEEVVCQRRVDVEAMSDVSKVPFACDEDELSVIPVEDNRPVGLALHDVARQLVVESRQQQRWHATDRRQPVLEHVIEYDVVERQDVFHFDVTQTVL